jgi:riboflavin kinase/FMN adenylyltransferase
LPPCKKPELAPARVGTLRDKLPTWRNCGVDQTVVLPFDARLASRITPGLHHDVLVQWAGRALCAGGRRLPLWRQRAGDYAMLDAAGDAQGFDVARMNSYEVHGLRVSSSAVREALGQGRMQDAPPAGPALQHLGPRGAWAQAGSHAGFQNPEPALCPLEARRQRHFCRAGAWTGAHPLQGVANLGVRPSLDPNDVNGGRVLLETHCLDWPAALGPRGPTVKSSAWNCCTNCTTS